MTVTAQFYIAELPTGDQKKTFVPDGLFHTYQHQTQTNDAWSVLMDGPDGMSWSAGVQPGSADVTWDGNVDVDDLLQLLKSWGPTTNPYPDLDHDGTVGVSDLIGLLNHWS